MSWFLGRRCSALCVPRGPGAFSAVHRNVRKDQAGEHELILLISKIALLFPAWNKILALEWTARSSTYSYVWSHILTGDWTGLIPEVLPVHGLHGQPLFPPTAQRASRADQQCKWLWNALTDRAFTWGYGGLISCVPECDKWQSKCCDSPSSSVEARQLEHKGGKKNKQQNPERSEIRSKKHNRTPGRHQLLRQARQQWQIYRWNLWRLFAWQYVGWTDSEWNIASRSEYFNKGKLKICGDWAFKLPKTPWSVVNRILMLLSFCWTHQKLPDWAPCFGFLVYNFWAATCSCFQHKSSAKPTVRYLPGMKTCLVISWWM